MSSLHRDRASPPPRLRSWLIISVSAVFVLCLAIAAGLGFDTAGIENGPQELLEIAFLAVSTAVFLYTAVTGAGPGAPLLGMLGLLFGVMALREFEAPIDTAPFRYLASHLARYHWAALCLVMIAGLTWRDRRWSAREHLSGVRIGWAALLLAAVIVGTGELVERSADYVPRDSAMHAILQWGEETLEVCGYVVAATASVWMARIRRPSPA